MAQIVKSLPEMWETRVRSFDQEDIPGEEYDNPLQSSSLEIPRTEEPQFMGSQGLDMIGQDTHTHTQFNSVTLC